MKVILQRKSFVLLLILLILFFILPSVKEVSAKEKKTTKMEFSLIHNEKKAGEMALNVEISDTNGLKSVKYAEGVHRKQFFKYSYYKKKIKDVKLSSAKKISFQVEVNPLNSYSFYIENKKGKVDYRVISLNIIEEQKENIPQTSDSSSPSVTPGAITPEVSTPGAITPEIVTPSAVLPETVTPGAISSDYVTPGAITPELTTPGGITPIAPIPPSKKESKIKKKDALKYTIHNERRTVWISFLEFTKKGYSEKDYREKIVEMFDEIKRRKLNTIYLHVRPFSDAMYPSKYYPWSVYASGKEGKDPGYDPLKIAVEEAHQRGLKLHAYINPYRINYATVFEALKKDKAYYKWHHPAYAWLNDEDEENDRNVLRHGTMYYYNPAKQEVVDLIANGVKEICENYDVDGVIFDDYFYPYLGKKPAEVFDSEEYEEYVAESEELEVKPMSIASWRRENTNKLIKNVYKVVKGAGKGQEFGISPAGNINNLVSSQSYLIDIKKWLKEDGFVDYIEPQLYWSFSNKYVPFKESVDRWKSLVVNPNTKLYIAIPISYLEGQPDEEWKKNPETLALMLQTLREKEVKGFSLFRYNHMLDSHLKRKGAKEGRDIFFDIVK